ncbi:hypothetical protein E2562_037518, partial [Oryza meyeriana var. granulata]
QLERRARQRCGAACRGGGHKREREKRHASKMIFIFPRDRRGLGQYFPHPSPSEHVHGPPRKNGPRVLGCNSARNEQGLSLLPGPNPAQADAIRHNTTQPVRHRRRLRPAAPCGALPSLCPTPLGDATRRPADDASLAMQAVGATAAFSPALTPSPARRSRRRFSRRCQSGRILISAGYSQLEVRGVSYRPPGTEQNLLNEISLSLRDKSFGLLFGRSGSGKTTLLQLLAGLSEPTHGTICIQKYNDSGNPLGPSELLTAQRVGIVFQFPERYFLADTVLEEITFGWPQQNTDFLFRETLALKLQNAINSVRLNGISLEEDPQSLSGGFKRRLALAIQLVQTPDLLLLDEPLAGLDWKARADVVNLLKDLKKDHTILAVSHDLR